MANPRGGVRGVFRINKIIDYKGKVSDDLRTIIVKTNNNRNMEPNKLIQLVNDFVGDKQALSVCGNHNIKMDDYSVIRRLDDVLIPLNNLKIETEEWLNSELKVQYYQLNREIYYDFLNRKQWDLNFRHGYESETNYFIGPFGLWFGLNKKCFFTEIPLMTYHDWYLSSEETRNHWCFLIQRIIKSLGGDIAVYSPTTNYTPSPNLYNSSRGEFSDWLAQIVKTKPPEGNVFYKMVRAVKYYQREENRQVPPITIIRYWPEDYQT